MQQDGPSGPICRSQCCLNCLKHHQPSTQAECVGVCSRRMTADDPKVTCSTLNPTSDSVSLPQLGICPKSWPRPPLPGQVGNWRKSEGLSLNFAIFEKPIPQPFRTKLGMWVYMRVKVTILEANVGWGPRQRCGRWRGGGA